jgi:hypothetical protein
MAAQIVCSTMLEIILHQLINTFEFAPHVFDRDGQAMTAAGIMQATLGVR